MLVAGQKPLTTGASVNLFKSTVVCVAVLAICGCDRGQPTPPVASNPTPVATSDPTPVEDMELPESANSIGMKFKLIPAGTFTMGDDNDAPEVTLSKSFSLGIHEVTQSQYERVMGNNPSGFKGANNPVEQVSWEDAVEFCRKLSELPAEKAAGRVYRLPTEAEWEYACRAGTTTKYSFGDDDSELGNYAWFKGNSGNTSHPVGGKKPNAWGLYDMHGNVWEWCQDWYGDYPSGTVTDPMGATSGSYRVNRGGRRPAVLQFEDPYSRWFDPHAFRVKTDPARNLLLSLGLVELFVSSCKRIIADTCGETYGSVNSTWSSETGVTGLDSRALLRPCRSPETVRRPS